MRTDVRALLWTALFVSLTSLGGWVRIPVAPVPFTLQTLFVYLSGDLLGNRRGFISQVLFLMLGLIGVPVFSMGGGLGYIFQPTFGYLLGFPLAAWTVGVVCQRLGARNRWMHWMICNTAGMCVILTTGVLYLAFYLRFIIHQEISWEKIILSGLIVFIPGEVVKMSMASILAKRMAPFFHDQGLMI
ncbi:MAG TPA: biotin transporter BioY [bacterium]|nr:biotin transporter BioY [bacterium]